MKQRELSHSRGTISHTTSDTAAMLLYSLSFSGAGDWFQSTSHQHLKPEMQKARRPKCWHWIKPLSFPATAFWEERCPKLSIYIWLWPSNGSGTETSLRLRLSCSERASSYKISSEFHEKSSSGFLRVPHLALNLLLRVKDTAVSLFIYFFIYHSGKQAVVIWNTFPPMTATFNLFEWAISPLWHFCRLKNMMQCDWGGNVINHGTARITRFF